MDWRPGPGAAMGGAGAGSGQVRSGQGAAMGRVPGADAGRGRGVVHGPECGPVADVGRGALRIPGGAAARSLAGAARPSKWVFGSSYTRRQSTRSLVGNRCGSLPTPSRAIHPARQMHHAACIMQHDACSVQHAPCNGKQQKCNFLHARDDSMLASMHFDAAKPTPKPKPRQGRANERTLADSNMSVNLAPEAVVATTSGVGG